MKICASDASRCCKLVMQSAVPAHGRSFQEKQLTAGFYHRHFCLPQSSSASRFTAGASAFFILSQSGERPER
jgi:hypothetical protein